MYRILISDKLGQAGLDRLDRVEDATYDLKPGLSKEELIEILPQYDALIVRSGTKVDADVVAAGANLKVVGRAGIGVDNIDIEAATQRGVIVMNTPAANSVATAEQTMALMLAVSRHTASAHASLKAGEWRRSEFVGTELHGKMLGIIGFGKVGRLVAERAQAFGMEVIACDPYISEEVGRALNVTLVDLDDLLPHADYIALHTALVEETTGMINAETLGRMKEGAILVNCARGKLIDEAALAEALQSGRLTAAALDVYTNEPPDNSPLIGLPNVLHTPHLGASTIEAQRAVATEIVDQVLDALRGKDFRNSINMPFRVSDFEAIRPYLALAERLGSLQAGLADGPIRRVEVEVHGDGLTDLVKAIASGILKGILSRSHEGPPLNYVNAPILADQAGIQTTQTLGKNPVDYPNLIFCRVRWDDGERLLGGVLFGGSEPRIVRIDQYVLEAKPEGVVLVMQNKDVPGVIGQIGTILAAYEINIGEWRMGRDTPGGEALSVINLDSAPGEAAIDALKKITAVTQLKVVVL